jgi:hypothetical protein
MISIKHGSLETSVYAHLLCFFSGLFICPSALTTVVWTYDISTSSLFPKFWGCDVLGLILAMTWHLGSPKMGACFCFLFRILFSFQNSPLHHRLYIIYRLQRRKTNHDLTFHRNYVFVKCTVYSHQLVLYWRSYWIYVCQTEFPRVVINFTFGAPVWLIVWLIVCCLLWIVLCSTLLSGEQCYTHSRIIFVC